MSRKKDFLDLNGIKPGFDGSLHGGCAFIAGDPSEARKGINVWCGEDRKPGSSYCPDHHRRCHTPAKPRAVDGVSKETRLVVG